MNDLLLLTNTLSLAGFALTLARHLLFKRKLYQLKQALIAHQQQHGIDEALWAQFHVRTTKMLRFWQ